VYIYDYNNVLFLEARLERKTIAAWLLAFVNLKPAGKQCHGVLVRSLRLTEAAGYSSCRTPKKVYQQKYN
jgi:hypothetical protein